MKIKDVLTLTLTEHSNSIELTGWVQHVRKQQQHCFVLINDGSCVSGIQLICSNEDEFFNELKTVNKGCLIRVLGKIVHSPASGQKYECKVERVLVINKCDPIEYPIKKRNTVDTLRQIAHLRTRTPLFGCIMRIRNTVMYETHKFFQDSDYMHLDPNILTINECEGGAGVFQATEWCPKTLKDIPSSNSVINWKKDHFKQPVYLTVSSQLQLEALACSLGNVYTTNKSFRAEHSLTSKHMSEFTHLEIEVVSCNNDYLMTIGESYINYIINKVFENNYDDLVELNKNACKGLLERYIKCKDLKYHRIRYKDCIETLHKNGFKITFGDDLSSEMENFLCEYYNGAVFVYRWPFPIKSFYMKRNKDDTCECFDLLMPYGIGELIGGSMREERYGRLLEAMQMKGMKHDGLEWYIDLRKFGTIPHGGFGLGLDRLLMLVTGMKNIKDVVPFPVYYQSCKY